MDKNSVIDAVLWVILFVALLFAVIFANVWFTDANFSESAGASQAIVAAIAIIAAAVFAVLKLQIFREFAPHLTVSQRVSHRPVGESYLHLDVSVELRNSSKVKIELHKGLFVLQQIAPVDDKEVERLYSQVFVDGETEDILWPKLYEVNRGWEENALIVEPGESHQEMFEYVVSSGVNSVLVYGFFYNPYSSDPTGWGTTTIYDIS